MKKVLALLVVIIVAAAAFTPCCSATADCVSEATRLSLDGDEEGDDTGSCSPFFSCTTCPGFIAPARLIAAGLPPPIYPPYFSIEAANISTPYYATPWQPPRNC